MQRDKQCEHRLDSKQSHLHVTLGAGQVKHGAAQSLLAGSQSPSWRWNNSPSWRDSFYSKAAAATFSKPFMYVCSMKFNSAFDGCSWYLGFGKQRSFSLKYHGELSQVRHTQPSEGNGGRTRGCRQSEWSPTARLSSLHTCTMLSLQTNSSRRSASLRFAQTSLFTGKPAAIHSETGCPG